MRQAIDYGGTFLAWGVALARARAAIRNHGQNERLLKAWLFALSFALFGTFEIDPVYLAVDGLLGLNNFSWLLSSIFLALTIHFLCTMSCRKRPRWALPALAGTIAGLVLVFPFGPNRTPDRVHHPPLTPPELLFTGLLYSYGASMLTSIPSRAFVQAYRHERSLLHRLKALIALCAVVAGIVFFVAQSAALSSTSVAPFIQPFAPLLTKVALLSAGTSVFLWPLNYAPDRFYALLGRPIEFLDEVLVLRKLGKLRARLDRLCPSCDPGPASRATWWRRLNDPELYIFQEAITIADYRRRLAIPLEGEPPNVDERDLEEAARLHRQLQDVTSSDVEGLVAAYRELSERPSRGEP